MLLCKMRAWSLEDRFGQGQCKDGPTDADKHAVAMVTGRIQPQKNVRRRV